MPPLRYALLTPEASGPNEEKTKGLNDHSNINNVSKEYIFH